MAVDVEEQEPKVSTEDLADRISVKDDQKSEDHTQVEAENELKVLSSEASIDKDIKNEKTVSDDGKLQEVSSVQAEEAAALQETEAGQESTATKKPKSNPFSFFSRLLRGSGGQGKQSSDVEAGTELLSKAGEVTGVPSQEELSLAATPVDHGSKQSLKHQETEGSKKDLDADSNKQEKSSPESDVTVQVVPDEKDGKRNGKSSDESSKMFTSRFNSVRWRWILSGFLLFFIIFILAGFLAAQLAYLPPEEGTDGSGTVPLAVTSCGPVLGVKEEGVFIFRGLPYALPPLKDRRWKPPFLPSRIEDCWQGTLLAQNYSAHCWQKKLNGQDLELSENCLTLNIITPNLSYQKPLPVVIYMSGSTFLGLDENDLSWQPSPHLAKEQGVVFVTFNYRLNLFGFMTLDILGKEVYPPTSGNYGLYDQLAVLKWVAKNIRHFGGDPDRVTLLAHGSSATAGLALVSSKKTKGLLKQAWLTGGSALYTEKNLKEVEMDNTDFLKNTGCDSAACLQEKSAEELMQALPEHWGRRTPLDLPMADEEHVPALAVIDGAIIFDQPANIWRDGDLNGINVVLGSTAQESSLWPSDKPLDQWSWDDLTDYVTEKMDTINSTISPQILNFYVDNSSTPEAQFHSMVSDLRVVCPLQDLAEQLPETSKSKVYFYVLTYKPSTTLNGTGSTSTVPMASHGLDVLAILGQLDQYLMETSPLDLVYQSNVQDLFYSFVRNGEPVNGNVELKGPRFVNQIAENVVSSTSPYKNCKVWEELKMHKFGRMN